MLDAVSENEIEDLNAQDFVYVKIANDTIKRYVVMNVVIASAFIVISPWGHLLPSALAAAIAFFTVNILWIPASFFMEINLAWAIVYIAIVVGCTSFVCFKVGQRIISPEEEEEVRVQW